MVAVMLMPTATEGAAMPVVRTVAVRATVIVAATVPVGITDIPNGQHRIIAQADTHSDRFNGRRSNSHHAGIQGDAGESGE